MSRLACRIRRGPTIPASGNTTVLLATGLSAKGDPVLAGVVVEPQGAKAAWHVPLRALPKLTACTFMSGGGIQVLLVSDDGKQSVARKLEVDETGKVLSPEHDIRTTSNAIVAVATGRRSPQAFFLMLEADRARHGRMALLKVPSKGEAKIMAADLGFPQGWPSIQTPGSAKATGQGDRAGAGVGRWRMDRSNECRGRSLLRQGGRSLRADSRGQRL